MTFKNYTFLSILIVFIVCAGLIHGCNEKTPEASDGAMEQHEDIDAHDHHDENLLTEDSHEEYNHTDAGSEEKSVQGSHSEHQEGDGHKHGEETGIIEMTSSQQKETGLVIATAHTGNIQNTLSFSGEIRLNEDRVVRLVPLVSGIVHSVYVSLGENVRKGQELAKIESPELAGMKADYLEKSRNVDLARFTFERKEYLWQEKIASEADRLEADAAFKNAETSLLAAKQRLMAIGLDEKQLLDISKTGDNDFGSYTISAPISGTVIARRITRGEKVDGAELFILADLSTVWVDLQVPAKDIRLVSEGQSVEIISAEGRREDGKLSMVSPVINKESRSILARVIFPNPERYWKPGQFVTGKILNKTMSSAVVVPSEAVQNIDGETIVFVPEGDGFRPMKVILGRSSLDKTEIVGGLEAGDRYVAKGAFSLKAIKVTSGVGSHAGHGH